MNVCKKNRKLYRCFSIHFFSMTRPATWARLTWPTGNNAFAYQQRKLLEPEPQLRLPALKHISSIDKIELGTLPTFTELDDHDNVITYTGLKYIYHMPLCMDALPRVHNAPIYIFDNHNYALYFWAQQWANNNHSYRVIHIDQHSDLGTPPEWLPWKVNDENNNLHISSVYTDAWQWVLNDIAHYTTHICNVGNFIRPALDAGIISECVRIKNEYDLNQTSGSYQSLQTHTSQKSTNEDFILDIDLDFWAPGMGTDLAKSIPLVQSLMREASLITIASSPYFLDQSYALELLKKLFGK